MGNVLIRFDPEYFIEREGIADPSDRRLIMRELFLSAEWAQMDSGALTEESAEPLVLSRVPERLHGKVKHLLHSWACSREMIPDMEDLVRRLKQSGYRLYLLSNASVAQHEYWPQYPVSRYFDGKLISCDIGYVKPMYEIYREFIRRFTLREEECLFVDDAPCNVAAAIACGWQGIVFHGDESELEEKLLKSGITIQNKS